MVAFNIIWAVGTRLRQKSWRISLGPNRQRETRPAFKVQSSRFKVRSKAKKHLVKDKRRRAATIQLLRPVPVVPDVPSLTAVQSSTFNGSRSQPRGETSMFQEFSKRRKAQGYAQSCKRGRSLVPSTPADR